MYLKKLFKLTEVVYGFFVYFNIFFIENNLTQCNKNNKSKNRLKANTLAKKKLKSN